MQKYKYHGNHENQGHAFIIKSKDGAMQIMSTYSDDVIAFGVDDEDEGRQTNYIEEKIQEEEFQ